jgi:hypothetical protein
MVEINLLPWREFSRVKKLRLQKLGIFILAIISICALALVVWLFEINISNAKNLPLVNPSAQKDAQLIETLQKIKYVGYLQQDKRIWGLVIALDGKVQVVEVGGVIGQIGQILRLSESQLEIQLPRNTLLTIPLSHE